MNGPPRVRPGERRDLGAITYGLVRVLGRAAGTRAPNLFATLGRNRGLFYAWLTFASRLMPFGDLPRREAELVILRVAHLRSCRYELAHHTRLGRRAGLDDRDLQRIEEGPEAQDLAPRDRALLLAADALVRDRDLGDATWTELAAHVDERTRLEVVMLVLHYDMLATAIGALRIAPDELA